MNKEQYLETVHEQIQAYGYEPRDVPPELAANSIFTKRKKGNKKNLLVATIELEEANVQSVREAARALRKAVKDHKEEYCNDPPSPLDFSQTIICFPLLVPPSVSEQMEIYVEKGHDLFGGEPWYRTNISIFPVLVDLENERLVHRESSGLKKLYYKNTFGKTVENLFQL